MVTILEAAVDLLESSLDGEPPPPDALGNLGAFFDQLSAVSIDPSGEGIDRWISTLTTALNDARLQETLLVRALQMRAPRLAEAMLLAGVVTVEWNAADRPAAFRIDWPVFDAYTADPGGTTQQAILGRLQSVDDIKAMQALLLALSTAPQALLELEYQRQGFASLPLGGDPPGANLQDLIDLIQSPLRVALPIPLDQDLDGFIAAAQTGAPVGAGSIAVDATIAAGQMTAMLFEVVLPQADAVNGDTIDLGEGWRLRFTAGGSGPQTYRIQGGPSGLDQSVRPPGDLGVSLEHTGSRWLIGEENGTHISAESFSTGARMQRSGPLLALDARLTNLALVLQPEFLRFLSFGLDTPNLLLLKASLDLRFEQGKGLSGSLDAGNLAAITVRQVLPLSFRIGTDAAEVRVDNVLATLEASLGAGGLGFRIAMTYAAQGQFGPLRAVMDGSGAWFGRWHGATSDFVPPSGIGLALAAGPVDGGGFLRVIDKGSFAGALQLKVLGIGAFAYGLYSTLANGDLSFVALIGIRLPFPGVQLGFGFAVSGFGGLVGINRRADTDLLRERLASGSAGDVLFNDNPMANAPKLLGDMGQFFPAESGVFLIGPTLQINWLAIIKLDAGVIIELPGPRKIFIAGSGRIVIGSEDFALVYIRVDFIGGIDTVKSLIFFDAALVNSHVLGIFRITGGVALRIAYGPNGYFLLSVGGFHPSFNPDGMELPRVDRVGTSVSLGPIWMKQQMYLAITSNTFQLGTSIEAGLRLGPISAHGWFAFDALIQFKPFHFVATIDAGFDVEVAGVSLCSVRVQGQLSGPGPLALQAKASVKILFVRISGSIAIELSSNPPERIVPIPDIPDHLRDELSKRDNLRFDGEDRSVRLRAGDLSTACFSPVGTLIWEQKRVPLDLPIQKLEGVDLGGWHTLQVTSTNLPVSGVEEDWFGVGTYLALPDAEALNTPRFAHQHSGIRVGAGDLTTGNQAEGAITLNLVKLPKIDPPVPNLSVFMYCGSYLTDLLRERGGGATIKTGERTVTVNQEGWDAHGASATLLTAVPVSAVESLVTAKQAGGFSVAHADKRLDLAGVI